MNNTGVDSGLATQKSDYVASVNYSPNRTYTFSVRSRFDEQTWNVQRFEAEARANFDRWSIGLTYGNYARAAGARLSDPARGPARQRLDQDRGELGRNGRCALGPGGQQARSDVIGAGYVDDCFVLAANYVTSYSYSAGTAPPVLGHAYMLQIGLRTLANTSSSGSGAGIQ